MPTQLTTPKFIDTTRLTLRLSEPGMAAALSAYHERNHDHFAPYCPRRPAGYHGESAWRERAAEQQKSSLEGDGLHWVLFERQSDVKNSIVGDINFTAVQRGVSQSAYLGYQLDREWVGKGMMSEALKAALNDVFQRMGLHRVMANYVPTNEKSGRLLKRLGFVVEGYARDYLLLEGVWKDHILTSLINPNWQGE